MCPCLIGRSLHLPTGLLQGSKAVIYTGRPVFDVVLSRITISNQYLNTQDRTSSLPSSSGWNKTLASRNCSLRRPSKKAGRKRARAAFGGRVGGDGRREYYVRNGSQTKNKKKIDKLLDFSYLRTVSKYVLYSPGEPSQTQAAQMAQT